MRVLTPIASLEVAVLGLIVGLDPRETWLLSVIHYWATRSATDLLKILGSSILALIAITTLPALMLKEVLGYPISIYLLAFASIFHGIAKSTFGTPHYVSSLSPTLRNSLWRALALGGTGGYPVAFALAYWVSGWSPYTFIAFPSPLLLGAFTMTALCLRSELALLRRAWLNYDLLKGLLLWALAMTSLWRLNYP